MRIFGRGLSRLVLAGGLLAISACFYGFSGGGLPSHIRTVAILPFDNETPEPSLTQEVSEAIRTAMENRLGLRLAAEATADAVVRGSITRYAADIPLSFQATGGNVNVTRRRVQLSLRVEIFDQLEQRVLWERTGIRVDGEYEPPNEEKGREVALEKLVDDIVDGAQSQW